MRSVKLMLCALLAGTSSLGCATIVKGGRTTVTVTSPTPDAEIVVKSFKGPEVFRGPSPAVVTVHKEDQYAVEVSAPGYRLQRQVISKSISGWAFGNLIFILPPLWAVGIAVDAASGALWSLDPEELTMSLAKAPPLPPATRTEE